MGTAIEVRAPAEQSEGTRSQVQRWLKAPGDAVREQDPLLELETDKVTVEIAAPASGTLLQIVMPEGTEVSPGDLLATIATTAAAGADADRRAAAAPGAGGSVCPPVDATPARPRADAMPSATSPLPVQVAGRDRAPSPAVRRLLAERGLAPADIRGSGPGGRITVDDVLDHGPPAVPAAPASPAQAAAPATPVEPRQPHTAMRRRIAERMVESVRTAPHVTTLFEADLGAVLAHRERHRAGFEARGAPLTLTAYFLSACVAALRAVPEANARWTDDALVLNEAMHIGVATALEDRGLVVPVVRDVQALDLFGIASALGELVARARADKLAPADVRGGTFTISNHGVSGSLLAAPIIINQPQSAILGVGRLEKRAVVVSEGGVERIVARPRCYVTLTIDHRVMDGHRANRFLEVLVGQLACVAD